MLLEDTRGLSVGVTQTPALLCDWVTSEHQCSGSGQINAKNEKKSRQVPVPGVLVLGQNEI